MGHISDIRDFFEAKLTTWVILLLFSAVFLYTQIFHHEFLEGLPKWVYPIFLILFMISSITVAVNIFVIFIKNLNKRLSFIGRSIRRRTLMSQLKKLDIGELTVVCTFLANSERSLKLNYDSISVISLYRKGVLKIYKTIVYSHSTPNYQIDEDVWMYISRSSYFEFDHYRLRHILQRDVSYAELVDCLPQAHPTIIALKNAPGSI